VLVSVKAIVSASTDDRDGLLCWRPSELSGSAACTCISRLVVDALASGKSGGTGEGGAGAGGGAGSTFGTYSDELYS
jgi:hypothetical protein